MAHELFEGVAAYDIPLIVKKLVEEGHFTHAELISRIEIFNYASRDLKNKASFIENRSGKLKASASEVRCLLRFFPLMLNDKFKDFKSKYWECFILLSEIVDFICAPSIHEVFLPYLQSKIKQYKLLES